VDTPREDHTVSRALAIYVVVQFAGVLSLAAYVLWLRHQHATLFMVMSAAWILVSLSSLGGLLDGRPRAAIVEGLRLSALPLVVLG
jgi:hypothetical protein